MASFAPVHLSGSTSGRPIKVTATSTPGTLIHTAVSGVTDFDEIWLFAVNTSTSPVKLTVEWGGTTSPDDLIEDTIPGESGLHLVIPRGMRLNGGVAVRIFAATTAVINITGGVDRRTA
jgi:hypothetical protein